MDEPFGYYPPPESQGGWRWLKTADEVREVAELDPERLELACEHNARFDASSAARELARFGYLMLRGGRWEDAQFIPAEWVSLATRASQPHNPSYGFTWWTNSEGTMWPGLPRDAFAAMGYMCNRLYVVPSLDLVVARVGSGPGEWSEGGLIQRIVDAMT